MEEFEAGADTPTRSNATESVLDLSPGPTFQAGNHGPGATSLLAQLTSRLAWGGGNWHPSPTNPSHLGPPHPTPMSGTGASTTTTTTVVGSLDSSATALTTTTNSPLSSIFSSWLNRHAPTASPTTADSNIQWPQPQQLPLQHQQFSEVHITSLDPSPPQHVTHVTHMAPVTQPPHQLGPILLHPRPSNHPNHSNHQHHSSTSRVDATAATTTTASTALTTTSTLMHLPSISTASDGSETPVAWSSAGGGSHGAWAVHMALHANGMDQDLLSAWQQPPGMLHGGGDQGWHQPDQPDQLDQSDQPEDQPDQQDQRQQPGALSVERAGSADSLSAWTGRMHTPRTPAVHQQQHEPRRHHQQATLSHTWSHGSDGSTVTSYGGSESPYSPWAVHPLVDLPTTFSSSSDYEGEGGGGGGHMGGHMPHMVMDQGVQTSSAMVDQAVQTLHRLSATSFPPVVSGSGSDGSGRGVPTLTLTLAQCENLTRTQREESGAGAGPGAQSISAGSRYVTASGQVTQPPNYLNHLTTTTLTDSAFDVALIDSLPASLGLSEIISETDVPSSHMSHLTVSPHMGGGGSGGNSSQWTTPDTLDQQQQNPGHPGQEQQQQEQQSRVFYWGYGSLLRNRPRDMWGAANGNNMSRPPPPPCLHSTITATPGSLTSPTTTSTTTTHMRGGPAASSAAANGSSVGAGRAAAAGQAGAWPVAPSGRTSATVAGAAVSSSSRFSSSGTMTSGGLTATSTATPPHLPAAPAGSRWSSTGTVGAGGRYSSNGGMGTGGGAGRGGRFSSNGGILPWGYGGAGGGRAGTTATATQRVEAGTRLPAAGAAASAAAATRLRPRSVSVGGAAPRPPPATAAARPRTSSSGAQTGEPGEPGDRTTGAGAGGAAGTGVRSVGVVASGLVAVAGAGADGALRWAGGVAGGARASGSAGRQAQQAQQARIRMLLSTRHWTAVDPPDGDPLAGYEVPAWALRFGPQRNGVTPAAHAEAPQPGIESVHQNGPQQLASGSGGAPHQGGGSSSSGSSEVQPGSVAGASRVATDRSAGQARDGDVPQPLQLESVTPSHGVTGSDGSDLGSPMTDLGHSPMTSPISVICSVHITPSGRASHSRHTSDLTSCHTSGPDRHRAARCSSGDGTATTDTTTITDATNSTCVSSVTSSADGSWVSEPAGGSRVTGRDHHPRVTIHSHLPAHLIFQPAPAAATDGAPAHVDHVTGPAPGHVAHVTSPSPRDHPAPYSPRWDTSSLLPLPALTMPASDRQSDLPQSAQRQAQAYFQSTATTGHMGHMEQPTQPDSQTSEGDQPSAFEAATGSVGFWSLLTQGDGPDGQGGNPLFDPHHSSEAGDGLHHMRHMPSMDVSHVAPQPQLPPTSSLPLSFTASRNLTFMQLSRRNSQRGGQPDPTVPTTTTNPTNPTNLTATTTTANPARSEMYPPPVVMSIHTPSVTSLSRFSQPSSGTPAHMGHVTPAAAMPNRHSDTQPALRLDTAGHGSVGAVGERQDNNHLVPLPELPRRAPLDLAPLDLGAFEDMPRYQPYPGVAPGDMLLLDSDDDSDEDSLDIPMLEGAGTGWGEENEAWRDQQEAELMQLMEERFGREDAGGWAHVDGAMSHLSLETIGQASGSGAGAAGAWGQASGAIMSHSTLDNMGQAGVSAGAGGPAIGATSRLAQGGHQQGQAGGAVMSAQQEGGSGSGSGAAAGQEEGGSGGQRVVRRNAICYSRGMPPELAAELGIEIPPASPPPPPLAEDYHGDASDTTLDDMVDAVTTLDHHLLGTVGRTLDHHHHHQSVAGPQPPLTNHHASGSGSGGSGGTIYRWDRFIQGSSLRRLTQAAGLGGGGPSRSQPATAVQGCGGLQTLDALEVTETLVELKAWLLERGADSEAPCVTAMAGWLSSDGIQAMTGAASPHGLHQ